MVLKRKMKKKFYIIFHCLLFMSLCSGCSNLLQESAVTQQSAPAGSKVTTTKEAVDYLVNGVEDLDTTVQLYVDSDNINANEITNAISRKINYAKKDYDLCNVKGCTMQTYRADNYSEITITLRYYMSLEQAEYVDKTVKELAPALKGADNVETYKNIFEWICTNVTYDFDTAAGEAERFSAYNALKEKKAVCYGYAALYQKFCDELGLDCMVLTSMDDSAHAWNVVTIREQYYHVDTTFGAGDPEKGVLWDYFLCGQDRIQYGNAYGIKLAKKSYSLK